MSAEIPTTTDLSDALEFCDGGCCAGLAPCPRCIAKLETRHSQTTAPKWQSWTDDGCHRTHKDFATAERYARRAVRSGNKVEITRGFHAVARVRIDAMDRVWTDVIDGKYA